MNDRENLRALSLGATPSQRAPWDRSTWIISGFAIGLLIAMYTRPQGLSGQLILAVGTLLFIALSLRGFKHPPALKLPWLITGLAALSALWADDSWNVLTRSMALAVPLLLAGIIANNVPFEQFLKAADRTLKTLVLASLAVGVAIPSIGLTQDAILNGTFRGIFVHRNLMGYVVVLAAVTLMARRWGVRGLSAGTSFWIVTYAAASSWTGSAGAVVLLLISFALYGFVRWVAHQRPIDRIPLLASTLFLTAFTTLAALPHSAAILGLFGRDLTFTNRVYIWQGAIQAWESQFWLGYGWGSILGVDDEAANVIKRSAGWLVTSTHNGYLATALQLGAVGLVLSALFLLTVLYKSVNQAMNYPGAQALWSLQVVMILIIGDITETRALVNIGWFLLCLVAYYGKLSPRLANEVEGVSPNNAEPAKKFFSG